MNMTIPDSIPKLLVFIGLFLVGYSTYQSDLNSKEFDKHFDKSRTLQDSFDLKNLILKRKVELLKEKSEYLSKKYAVENPISFNDSILIFKRCFEENKTDYIVYDSIQKSWNEYSNAYFEIELLAKKIDNANTNSLAKIQWFNDEEEYLFEMRMFGLSILFLGFIGWLYLENKKSKKSIKKSDLIFKYCQSCGEKFSSIVKFGTEKNKEYSKAFCSKCYKKGKFTNPDLTTEEFKTNYENKIKNLSFIKQIILKSRLNKLERWKEDNYF